MAIETFLSLSSKRLTKLFLRNELLPKVVSFELQLTGPLTAQLSDEVNMLAHIYPHKPLTKNKVTICNHQADRPLYVWPDV